MLFFWQDEASPRLQAGAQHEYVVGHNRAVRQKDGAVLTIQVNHA